MKILNELAYAEKLLKHGFTKKISIGELIILAKYFRYVGKNDGEIEEELLNFCCKHESGFVYELYLDAISRAIKSSEKYLLRIPIDIPITKNELEIIKSIKNYRYEKVLFTMLVLGKYHKLTNTGLKKSKSKLYFISGYDAPIFRLAHTSEKKNERIMHYLFKNGYIDNNVKYNSYILKFTSIEDDSEIAFYVTDIENIIRFYPPHCNICGNTLDKTGNRQNMCKECKNEEQKRLSRESMRKIRIVKF